MFTGALSHPMPVQFGLNPNIFGAEAVMWHNQATGAGPALATVITPANGTITDTAIFGCAADGVLTDRNTKMLLNLGSIFSLS